MCVYFTPKYPKIQIYECVCTTPPLLTLLAETHKQLHTITREGLNNKNFHFQTKGSIFLPRILIFATELYKTITAKAVFNSSPNIK